MKEVNVLLAPDTLAVIDAAAVRLGCSRHRLVGALIHCIGRDDMIDAVLDGDDPKTLVPWGGKGVGKIGRPRGSALQAAVLAEIVRHIGLDGTATVSLGTIAATIGSGTPDTSGAVKSLIAAGRLVRVREYDRATKMPSIYRVVDQVPADGGAAREATR